MKDNQLVSVSKPGGSKVEIGSRMSFNFDDDDDRMPPDCKDEDDLSCPVPQQSKKKNSLFEMSTLAYADDDQGTIL